MQREGIRGADLVFACVGPALEIYSRYSGVETAEGRPVELPEYLERVWEVVGREALEQVLGTAEAQARNGAAGALEEDARLTALFLWTLQSTGDDVSPSNGPGDEEEETGEDDEAPARRASGFSLLFDVARRFAQPLGIHMEEWENRIIHTDKGVVPAAARRRPGKGAIRGSRGGQHGRRDRVERCILRTTQPVPGRSPHHQGDEQGEADEQQWPLLTTRKTGGTQRPWTGSTPPCCSKPRDGRRRSVTSSVPNRTGGQTSCGYQTPCPPSTPVAARRSGSWMACCWPHRDNFFPLEVKYANRSGVAGAHYGTPRMFLAASPSSEICAWLWNTSLERWQPEILRKHCWNNFPSWNLRTSKPAWCLPTVPYPVNGCMSE